MDNPPENKAMIFTAEQLKEQVELAKKIINDITPENIQGLILTLAVTPNVQELTPQQVAEIEAEGLQLDETSKVSHVLIGSLPALVQLFRTTGHTLYETYKASEVIDKGSVPPPGQVLH